jgi:hypothetical protein
VAGMTVGEVTQLLGGTCTLAADRGGAQPAQQLLCCLWHDQVLLPVQL